MSAPGTDEERRRFFDSPRWMDGDLSLMAMTLCTLFGLFAAVGAVIWAIFIAVGRSPIAWVPAVVGLAVLSVLLFLVAKGANRRLVTSDAPTDAPPGRLFKVTLLARGGWLSRYLAPNTGAYLVLADDYLRLRWRRPHNEVYLMNLVFFFLSGVVPGLQGPRMLWLRMGGIVVLLVFQVWAASRRHDLRYSWDRVVSVSNWTERFHVRVDDDEFRNGFLLRIPAADREPATAVFKARSLFHDEAAAAMRAT